MLRMVLICSTCLGMLGFNIKPTFGQIRYIDKVFSEVAVTQNLVYAENISLLTRIPDTIPLFCDLYQPKGDPIKNRPVLLLAGTGNFLPPLFNGTPFGSIKDSTQVELAKNLAMRGYVVVNFYYRQGWDAANPDLVEQTRTFLQALYRGVQDARTCARWIRRTEAEDGNPYGIEPRCVGIMGLGTGGYIAYTACFLNDFVVELNVPMFQDPATGEILVDQAEQGNLEGTDTTSLNIANHVGFSSAFQLCVNMGGGLLDTSWINLGEPPSISFHCTEDENVPYKQGRIIGGFPGNYIFPNMAGSWDVSRVQDRLGNNYVFKTLGLSDPYTIRANGTNDGWEGLFPFVLPDTGGIYDCLGTPIPLRPQGSPWAWWNESQFIADWNAAGLDTIFGYDGIMANCNLRLSNPDMSPSKGRSYVDTLASYMGPRIIGSLRAFGTKGANAGNIIAGNIDLFPNPAQEEIGIQNADPSNPIIEIRIMNQQGQEIYHKSFEPISSIRVLRQNWSNGLYIVRLSTKKGVVYKQLLLD